MLQYLQPRTIGRVVNWLAYPRSTKLRNIRNVLVDGIGVGMVMGIASFLPVFLIRLGASNFLVGLLTAMPALAGMLLAVPIGRFLERQPSVVPWYSRARFLVFIAYALTGVAPFFFHDNTPQVIILIWALATLPQTVVNVAFAVVMGGVAGARYRFAVMSGRWSLLGFTNALMVAGVGLFLDRVAFPVNYQIAFIVSFVGGLISLYFSSSIELPERDPEAEADGADQGWRQMVVAVRAHPVFGRLLVSQFAFRFGQGMAMPLFPLYWVRNLQASDASIGMINTVNGAVLLVAYFIWARVARSRGQRFVLLAASFGVMLYPLATALTGSVHMLVVYAAIAGLCIAGLDLVLFDVLLAACPKEQQASFVGVQQMVHNGAIFFGPLLGTLLADRIGIVPALLTAAAMRLVAFGLFYALRVGTEEVCEPPVETAQGQATAAAR